MEALKVIGQMLWTGGYMLAYYIAHGGHWPA
jgi:hypothetical protein